MEVKLVKDNHKKFFTCDNVTVTVLTVDMIVVKSGQATPGIIVELTPGPTLRLPDDGDSVYLLNAQGRTVDAYHWPIRPRTAAEPQQRGDAEIHTPSR